MNNSFSHTLYFLLGFGFFFSSCKNSDIDDYSAYFGGEIINPKDQWVFFYKGETLLDSIPLNSENRFFVAFDSLTPGLYTFKHLPEYQYVYFDKNDSLMVRVNTSNFDESLVFCGKGEEKNNFLVEMYLKVHKDRSDTFWIFDLPEDEFSQKADSSYQATIDFYNSHKEHILWSDEFDVFARASIDYPYYTKKEFYPVAHRRRNIQDAYNEIPAEFYDFRKNVDFNSQPLTNFSPYLRYVTTAIDNIANQGNNEFAKDGKTALKKLEIIDTLTQNQALKNKVANNIAFFYLIDHENNAYDEAFLEQFYSISTDEQKKEEIRDLVRSIRNIVEIGHLPDALLKDAEGNNIQSQRIFDKKTILYFWSKKTESHFFAVNRRLNRIIEKYPDLDVVAINLDDSQQEWIAFWERYKAIPNPKIKHFRAAEPDSLKDKWAITRITRASIIDKNAKVNKGFVNIFDAAFEQEIGN